MFKFESQNIWILLDLNYNSWLKFLYKRIKVDVMGRLLTISLQNDYIMHIINIFGTFFIFHSSLFFLKFRSKQIPRLHTLHLVIKWLFVYPCSRKKNSPALWPCRYFSVSPGKIDLKIVVFYLNTAGCLMYCRKC